MHESACHDYKLTSADNFKLRQLGIPNQIADNSDSNDDMIGCQFSINLYFEVEIDQTTLIKSGFQSFLILFHQNRPISIHFQQNPAFLIFFVCFGLICQLNNQN